MISVALKPYHHIRMLKCISLSFLVMTEMQLKTMEQKETPRMPRKKLPWLVSRLWFSSMTPDLASAKATTPINVPIIKKTSNFETVSPKN